VSARAFVAVMPPSVMVSMNRTMRPMPQRMPREVITDGGRRRQRDRKPYQRKRANHEHEPPGPVSSYTDAHRRLAVTLPHPIVPPA
jgi:hypothetical protein